MVAAAAATLQVPNGTTSKFVAHLQFIQHRAWSHAGLGSCMAVCTKLANLPYYFQMEFCLTFLNICVTDQQTPKIVNVIYNIAFSHMEISKGFPSTPGIVTWHKISQHMCPNCTPCNGSTVTLRLVPSLSSILQPGFHIMPEWFRLSYQ